MSQISIPGKIHWQTSQEFLAESLALFKGKRVLLVCNTSNAQRLSLIQWCEELRDTGRLCWINKIAPNPTYMDVLSTLQLCDCEAPEVVVAIGGGSTIDLAKACVALWYLKSASSLNCAHVLNSIITREYLQHASQIPILAVPTTAGTGSEVTRWATVWDANGKEKHSIEAAWLCPKHAYIIPEYTSSMPPRLTLATGLDALCHAVEAYWAKSSNPMVRELSKASIRLIIQNLPKTLSDASDLYYRKQMCLGSLFAGLAFSHTRTTACHSISYPLTMRFGVEHGFACALSLAQVLKINLPMIDESADLMEALGANTPADLQLWLDRVANNIVQLRLSTFGVQQSDIEDLVEMSFTKGRMDNNPVAMNKEDIRCLLHSLM